MNLDIVTAPKRNSRHWTQDTITWDELVGWMSSPARVKECGNYMLGVLRPTTLIHEPGADPCTGLHRSKAAVVSRSALTLDVDSPSDDFLDRVSELGYKYLIHTTFSSTADAPRYRLIIPTDRALLPDEYAMAASVILETLGADSFDPGSIQPERYMFKPSGADFWYEESDQDQLAPTAELLAGFDPDLASVPLPKPSRRKRDPFAIEGTIGAFNRAYADLAELIDEYDLPYEPAEAGRWKLIGAASNAGMGEVAPGLVYSHHSHDPAHGQAASAFDLARLHLFGHLDESARPGTPVNRLPSHTEMLEVATKDLKVVRELVGSDFADDMTALADQVDADTPPDNWKLSFTLSSRTGKPTDTIDNWDLIVANDPAFEGLYYNELNMAVETDRDLPWRDLEPGRETFDSGDRSSLALYLEREYGLRAARAYLDDLVNDKARRRRVNPVADYLRSLEWDGTPRVEFCLPGVEDTPYARVVARKVMVAAVARMLDPGCKWDHMLVLYGTEGLGKSYWVDRMSRGYSAALGRIGDKDTLISMQRSWIMTSDEGHALKRADWDAQKEFLTRTADVFRMPYEREAQLVKRHCVIWGTTNDETFFRRQEGNRRFLIVHCERRLDFDALTDEYVDQVWAEAVHLYRQGERLWLTDEEAEMAAAQREPFTEEDTLGGIIEQYLQTPVPANWDQMRPLDRQEYLINGPDELSARPTGRIDTVCSAQVWVEALGRRFGEHRRSDLLEITQALSALPGWERQPGQEWVPGYGKQTVFRRLPGGYELL